MSCPNATIEIDAKTVEGKYRVNYGTLSTLTSGTNPITDINTGLRMIYGFSVWHHETSGFVTCTLPTSFPEKNSTSGVVTVTTTVSSDIFYWRARGTV